MRLQEALEEAMHFLNSGGRPTILYRTQFLSGVGERGRNCRVYEVCMSWTQHENSSVRAPMIVETRERRTTGWTTWVESDRSPSRPFSIDGLMPHAMWGWRSRGVDWHACERCVENEVRTDEEMLKVYGSFKHKQHRCALKLFTEGGDTIEVP